MVWGGWAGHEPRKCVELFAPFLEANGFKVQISNSLESYLEKDAMLDLDLIVHCWTEGKILRGQLSALSEAVKSGVGLAGWHGGFIDSLRESPEFHFIVGGQWVASPAGVTKYEVNIADPGDPITQGISDFSVLTEQYYMHVDPSNHVLATTTFAGARVKQTAGVVMPVVWKRRWLEGRIFFSAIGHKASDFDVPEIREITQRGMLWASR